MPSKTEEHLNLLMIFQFIYSGLLFLGFGFLYLHYRLLSYFLTQEAFQKEMAQSAPFNTAEFFHLFKWFYLAMGVFLLTKIILNLLSGFFMKARTHRMFSTVIGGLNCVFVPLGTVLGVFTILILQSNETKSLYEEQIRKQ